MKIKTIYNCELCGKDFNSKEECLKHEKECSARKEIEREKERLETELKTAINFKAEVEEELAQNELRIKELNANLDSLDKKLNTSREEKKENPSDKKDEILLEDILNILKKSIQYDPLQSPSKNTSAIDPFWGPIFNEVYNSNWEPKGKIKVTTVPLTHKSKERQFQKEGNATPASQKKESIKVLNDLVKGIL